VATEGGGWTLVLAPAALKDLKRLSKTDRERIVAAIDRLPAGDVRRLRGPRPEWRLRVGDWRIRFERDDQARQINVLAVRSRGSAYRR
jgi:mRNA interferase RelE/StbE